MLVNELDQYVDSRRCFGPKSPVRFYVPSGPTIEELEERWRVHRRFPFEIEEIFFLKKEPDKDPPREKISRLVRFDEIIFNEPAFPERRTFNGSLYVEEDSRWAFNFRFWVVTIHDDRTTYGWGSWAFDKNPAS